MIILICLCSFRHPWTNINWCPEKYQCPRIRNSSTLPLSQKNGWRYLGNRKRYHRSTGVKISGKKSEQILKNFFLKQTWKKFFLNFNSQINQTILIFSYSSINGGGVISGWIFFSWNGGLFVIVHVRVTQYTWRWQLHFEIQMNGSYGIMGEMFWISPLAVFLKYGQLYFSKAPNSIYACMSPPEWRAHKGRSQEAWRASSWNFNLVEVGPWRGPQISSDL